MHITDIRSDLLKTKKLLIRIYTNTGIIGYSEGSGLPTSDIFQKYVDSVIKPQLIGSDPRIINRHWESLAIGNHDSPKLPHPYVGSVDIALWDILGKYSNLPVHALMGGAARKTIKLYWSVGSGWEMTPDEMLARVQEGRDRGFKAFKIRMDWKANRQDQNPEKD